MHIGNTRERLEANEAFFDLIRSTRTPEMIRNDNDHERIFEVVHRRYAELEGDLQEEIYYDNEGYQPKITEVIKLRSYLEFISNTDKELALIFRDEIVACLQNAKI